MKRTRHKIVFNQRADQAVVLQGQLGIGNRELARVTGLTQSQISYRLAKAKNTMGLESGFRVRWRNGNHPMLQRIIKDYSGIMVMEIERNLTRRLVHPTPEVKL